MRFSLHLIALPSLKISMILFIGGLEWGQTSTCLLCTVGKFEAYLANREMPFFFDLAKGHLAFCDVDLLFPILSLSI